MKPTNAFKTVADIMALWPSSVALAEDLDELPDTVRKWKARGRIPSDKLQAFRKAALERAKVADNEKTAAQFRKITADVLIQVCGA